MVGHGGREAALATSMAESSVVHAVMGHANPTITALVEAGGGSFTIGDVCDGPAIARFAVEHAVDLAMVSSDDPLAAGVVDELRAAGVAAVGPTRAGAEIEWNKRFCRQVVAQVASEANPVFAVAETIDQVDRAIAEVADGGSPVVVKPVGLAGGKGVKVVGPHLADNAEAARYAREVIGSGRHGGAVIIEERITAPEVTIQAMTDGRTVVFPPATYDYPYRFDGDTGPGTGGMGSCTMPGGLLPFVDRAGYDQACAIVQAVIDYLADVGRPFSGCMNAGFFATADGLRVIECNARFGDPEGINIMGLLRGDWVSVMEAMVARRLTAADVPLADEASVVTYLVAPEYALGTSAGHRFTVDVEAARAVGAGVLFSSAVAVNPASSAVPGTSGSPASSAVPGTSAVSSNSAVRSTCTGGAAHDGAATSTGVAVHEGAANDEGAGASPRAATPGPAASARAATPGPGTYETVGTSRAVAITAVASRIEDARSTVAEAIAKSVTGDLQWRSDIGIVPGKAGSSGQPSNSRPTGGPVRRASSK